MELSPYSFFVVGAHRLDGGDCHISHLRLMVTERSDGCFIYDIEDADGEHALLVGTPEYSAGARVMHRMIFHGIRAIEHIPGDPWVLDDGED
jgi:hypothetical protein